MIAYTLIIPNGNGYDVDLMCADDYHCNLMKGEKPKAQAIWESILFIATSFSPLWLKPVNMNEKAYLTYSMIIGN